MAGGADRARRIEWALGLVSALVVLAITLYLLREGLAASDPLAELAVVEVERVDGEVPQLRFVVVNRGGRTASAVSIALTFRDGDRPAERRRLIIDYVPARSSIAGGFVLSPEDAVLDPELVVEGYVDP